MEELLAQLWQEILPILATAMSGLSAWLIKLLFQWLEAKTENEKLKRFEQEVYKVVMAMQRRISAEIKAAVAEVHHLNYCQTHLVLLIFKK